MHEEVFTVGTIVGTHGLRGEVRVVSRTDFPELRFKSGSKLLLMAPGQTIGREVEVRSSYEHNRVYIVAFQEFTSIDEGAACKGFDLKVYKHQLAELPQGEYFIHDLIGCSVFSEEQNLLGTLTEVLTPGANDVYVVKNENGSSLLLPAIPDCILKVNVDQKRIDVCLMPGLTDL